MPRPPAGPDSPNYGRRGTRWRTLRAAILNASTICWLCGHPGADEVDHVIPRDQRPDLAMDPTNLRPAHKTCNAAKGNRPAQPTSRAGTCRLAGTTHHDRHGRPFVHPHDCDGDHRLAW